MLSRIGRSHLPLVAATLAVNLLALALPLTSRQIVKAGQKSPDGWTVLALVLLVLLASFGENLFRLGRSIMLAGLERNYRVRAIHWLMGQALRGVPPDGEGAALHGSPAAASLEYQRAIEQLRGRATGENIIAYTELLFVPVIMGIIFLVDWRIGLVVSGAMLVFAWQARAAVAGFHQAAQRQRGFIEQRFKLLFDILKHLPVIKGFAVEPQMARLYEHVHGKASASNLALAHSAARLSQTGSEMAPALTALLLISFAMMSAQEPVMLATVIATIIIAQRLVDPVQRAIFILMQHRDAINASERLQMLGPNVPAARGEAPLELAQEYVLRIEGLAPKLPDGAPDAAFAGLDLKVQRGEIIALSSLDPAWSSGMLRVIAGITPPSAGAVWLDAYCAAQFTAAQRAQAFGYVSAKVALFDGTIGDNITRFGAVSVPDAFVVARLLGVQQRLDELPQGLETPVGAQGGSNVPPGLARQIAILRALAHRPRIILLDHADQGLDRDAYADLVGFCEKLRGDATVLIASNDANFTSIADRHLSLSGGMWRESYSDALKNAAAYRSLVV